MSESALRSVVQEAAAEMQGDLAHRWSLAEIASSLYLSPSQVGRVFNDQIGMPPIALLARLRVREMARLLRESDMTVGEIGVRVGWRNRGHAAEQFAKIMGVTPTAYRNQYRQRTRQTADDLAGCLWCGQPLPTTDDDRDPRRLDGDPLIHD
ncbi:helix-turn-helix domain-containing protein [Schaalia hyovaginalis]|uniref:helix-turn-helix domain-containing protein n=1 Tax=Schaalia hyovaginalis TaxID=29316 RepID=UPI0023F6F27A|nr:AraC family transcriptional regulator [Schaalia hyovaginalis]MCI7671896.1 AraC family transcriptional regulator [Schaalia hyovaginalis]